MGMGVDVYCLVRTFAPGVFPDAFRAGMEVQSRFNFEAAAVITVLVLLAQVLEIRARAQTSGAIHDRELAAACSPLG